jgi:hypothetical protein
LIWGRLWRNCGAAALPPRSRRAALLGGRQASNRADAVGLHQMRARGDPGRRGSSHAIGEGSRAGRPGEKHKPGNRPVATARSSDRPGTGAIGSGRTRKRGRVLAGPDRHNRSSPKHSRLGRWAGRRMQSSGRFTVSAQRRTRALRRGDDRCRRRAGLAATSPRRPSSVEHGPGSAQQHAFPLHCVRRTCHYRRSALNRADYRGNFGLNRGRPMWRA